MLLLLFWPLLRFGSSRSRAGDGGDVAAFVSFGNAAREFQEIQFVHKPMIIVIVLDMYVKLFGSSRSRAGDGGDVAATRPARTKQARVRICMCVCMYVCMYIYIYIYYVCTYIYI